MNGVTLVIPARYASSRLPGKPLLQIAGKPMIQQVYERALSVKNAGRVLVAADDERVELAVKSFGGEVVMTSPDHASGTDRLAEVMLSSPADLYVNLQGDEPLVRPGDVEILIAGMLADTAVAIGTLCHPIDEEEAENPNTVKVVLAANGDALYFSRAKIPYPRENDGEGRYLKHVGVYAYRKTTLEDYGKLPQPMLERTEKLEQLRFLHAGYKIRAWQVEPTGPGVDTPECLEKVRLIFANR